MECDACVRTTSVCVCVCDLPWLRVSWLVSNDRLTLSCTPHPPGPPHTPHPTHPSALERHQILNLSCVCAMWVFVRVGVSVGSVFVILQLVGPVGKLKKILVMLCSDHQFFFCKCQGRNGFIGSFAF